MPAVSSIARSVTALVPLVRYHARPTSDASVTAAPTSKPLLSRSPSPNPSLTMTAPEAGTLSNDATSDAAKTRFDTDMIEPSADRIVEPHTDGLATTMP